MARSEAVPGTGRGVVGVGIKTDEPNTEPMPKLKKPNFRFLPLIHANSLFISNNRIELSQFGVYLG